jgi:hypothetical protein
MQCLRECNSVNFLTLTFQKVMNESYFLLAALRRKSGCPKKTDLFGSVLKLLSPGVLASWVGEKIVASGLSVVAIPVDSSWVWWQSQLILVEGIEKADIKIWGVRSRIWNKKRQIRFPILLLNNEQPSHPGSSHLPSENNNNYIWKWKTARLVGAAVNPSSCSSFVKLVLACCWLTGWERPWPLVSEFHYVCRHNQI